MALERPAGSHSLAAAAHRRRWAGWSCSKTTMNHARWSDRPIVRRAMHGRELAVSLLATTLIVWFFAAPFGTADAQPPDKLPRVGYISPGSSSDPVRARRFDAFREGLRELGYVEGKNIVLEPRWANGQYARYAALAADLIRLKPAVIVTVGGTVTKAASQVTTTVPIVMSVVVDPVGSGLVPNLAHPSGNVTGTSIMATDLVGKHFELIREVVPRVSRVALLWNPTNPSHAPAIGHVKAAAGSQAIQLQLLEARDPEEIGRVFAGLTRDQAAALVVLPDAIFTNQVRQIAELALQRRLPSIYGTSEYADAGGLMSYSTSLLDLERRAATFVDKILKGARPGDLPIEQPTKFELVINRKTATALELTIPPSMLLRADQVIE
jgi:putative ABC transport system substrate-binding protein